MRYRTQGWIVTFADMVTLLMVFFVMLIAVREAKIIKTFIILSAFEGKLGLLEGGKSLSPDRFEEMGQRIESLPSFRRGKSLSRALKKASATFKPDIEAKRMRITEEARGIRVSLFTDFLFAPNSARLNMEASRRVMENLKLLLTSGEFDNHIAIEGHTDARPYSGREYKDNWDLSFQRAWVVLNGLRFIPALQELDESKLSLHGYGPTRPVESNETPEGRQYNRRVDIVLIHDGKE